MKKIIILIGVLLFLIAFFPIRIVYKEGGTVLYKALAYSVTKHRERIEDIGYQTGTTIKVLNHTLYEKKNIPVKKDQNLPKLIRMVKLQNTIYYDTGEIITIGRCGVGIEKITDFVEENEIPTKNGQANFKGDIKYQFMAENEIDIWINDAWYRFEKREIEVEK